MIDLHCHLLPGIDDGPETLDEALEMARLAVAAGIEESWVTPHLHVGRWENDLARIVPAVEAYRAALAVAAIPLKVGFAAEVRLDYEIVPLIEAGRVPFYGELDGYKIMLLEFPHSHVPVGAAKFVNWLLQRRIRPMIAHPERNKDLMREPQRLEPFVAEGCLVQLTADAVAGEFGELSAQRAREFLERGWVSVLASDAHDTKARPPRIAAGRDVAAGIVGEAEARRLVYDIPLSIVRGA
ncbi:MAG: tyrosine-protein phosphatase [Burkholderiales bacterium]